MTFSVIQDVDFGNKAEADRLRDIADLIEAGEVRDMVIVYDHKGNKEYCSAGFFDDRWRMLGAIEYAKRYIFND